MKKEHVLLYVIYTVGAAYKIQNHSEQTYFDIPKTILVKIDSHFSQDSSNFGKKLVENIEKCLIKFRYKLV